MIIINIMIVFCVRVYPCGESVFFLCRFIDERLMIGYGLLKKMRIMK